MEENKGFILPRTEAVLADAGSKVKVLNKKGQIHVVKSEPDPKMKVYPMLRPITSPMKVGKEPSKYTLVSLEIIQPGGSLPEHYHEYNAEMPVFDHVFYVISGRVRAKIGDIEKNVGADTLIYCPSNLRHSLTNVGKGPAKYLLIAASPEKMGKPPVYVKKPR